MTRGFVYLLLSAFVFALATLFAKIIIQSSDVPPIELTFFRFLGGLVLVSLIAFGRRENLRPKKSRYVLLRALFNTLAVILFFTGIGETTVTKANMLNMTYPVFVFLLAPLINRESISLLDIIYLSVAMAGIYLVMVPSADFAGSGSLNRGDIFALASGLSTVCDGRHGADRCAS